jgi:hypothetical protein
MPITLKQYWKGRDVEFASELTDEIVANARETVRRANRLLERFLEAKPTAAVRTVNSGWRPKAVNKATANAAPNSKHLTAQAVDLSDDDEALDRWCQTSDGLAALEACELWMEHPDHTPRWCHVQTVPPASGKRVFRP